MRCMQLFIQKDNREQWEIVLSFISDLQSKCALNLISKKRINIQEANTAKTISFKAWKPPVVEPSGQYKLEKSPIVICWIQYFKRKSTGGNIPGGERLENQAYPVSGRKPKSLGQMVLAMEINMSVITVCTTTQTLPISGRDVYVI